MNKVKFGLKNVHYAKATIANDNTYSYATPVAIPGAVNMSLSASGEDLDFHADDVIYFSDSDNQGYEGDLELALLPKSFLKDILGYTEDANGALFENANDKISPFALGFEVQGDEKGRRTWLYNCVAKRPNNDASTKENSKTPKTETLSIKVMPRKGDKQVKGVLEETADNTTAYNGFFSAVYEKQNASV